MVCQLHFLEAPRGHAYVAVENRNTPENQPPLTCQLVTVAVKLSGTESVPKTYFFFIDSVWVPEIRGICLIDLFILSI